ncbi:MAG: L-threonylcarbamoyladenylate synthase [Acidobacteriota bacterium]
MLSQRLRVRGDSSDQEALEVASVALLNGGIVAVPTDIYYALGADPFNLRAVEQIFQIKGRQSWKPILLLVDSVDQAEEVAQDLPDVFYKIAEEFWPGPLTLIVPAATKLPRKITGGTGTVALRIPDLRITRLLIRAIDIPIVGTTANRAAHPPCASADDVLHDLGGKIELVLDAGPSRGNAPSTILDLTRDTPRIVREGGIPATDLAKYL